MKLISNAHTHTRFCDGQNTPEEMVQAALRLGFVSLGFSIHGWTPYELVPVTLEKEAAYRAELRRLQAKYAGRIEILIGAERDSLYPRDFSEYEYLIDSTHWFVQDGVYCCADYSEARMRETVRDCFGGDYYAYCRGFFRQEAQACARSDAAFLGHIDLVSKFNEGGRYFDESDPRYLGPALEVVDCAAARGLPIEMNTGAMFRGYRSSPYPAPALLRGIRDMGGEILINSDAHAAEGLDCGFDLCLQIARACGFKHILRLRKNGFEEVPIASE